MFRTLELLGLRQSVLDRKVPSMLLLQLLARHFSGGYPKPQTLNPKPQTPNSNPETPKTLTP